MKLKLGFRPFCYTCGKRCSGKFRDLYGEYVLKKEYIPVCKSCFKYLSYEDGPWNEINMT